VWPNHYSRPGYVGAPVIPPAIPSQLLPPHISSQLPPSPYNHASWPVQTPRRMPGWGYNPIATPVYSQQTPTSLPASFTTTQPGPYIAYAQTMSTQLPSNYAVSFGLRNMGITRYNAHPLYVPFQAARNTTGPMTPLWTPAQVSLLFVCLFLLI
jgi:hypothetical protein